MSELNYLPAHIQLSGDKHVVSEFSYRSGLDLLTAGQEKDVLAYICEQKLVAKGICALESTGAQAIRYSVPGGLSMNPFELEIRTNYCDYVGNLEVLTSSVDNPWRSFAKFQIRREY